MDLSTVVGSTLIAPVSAATLPSAEAVASITRVDASGLDALASASLSFLISTVILSFLVSVVLEVTSDLGMRRLMNWYIVKRFVGNSLPMAEIRIPVVWSGTYGLPYDELAGQFASWVRNWADEFLGKSTPESDLANARREVERVERRIDVLHTKLRSADRLLSVMIPLLATFVVIAPIYESLSSARFTSILAVAGMASLMSPFIREILRKFVRS